LVHFIKHPVGEVVIAWHNALRTELSGKRAIDGLADRGAVAKAGIFRKKVSDSPMFATEWRR